MRKLLILMILLPLMSIKVSAAELEFAAPAVPSSGSDIMIEPSDSFLNDILVIFRKALPYVHPAFSEAAGICLRVLTVIMILSVLNNLATMDYGIIHVTGVISLSVLLLTTSNSMISLGTDIIHELSNYNKLLLPVMTGALSAQGRISTSGALYTGTAFFDSILSSLIDIFFVPAIYCILALSIASRAMGDDHIKKMMELTKGFVVWALKIILYVFTGYMTISGAISGSTDAISMKAAKITISSAVPVVGGILADASEAVLVSASVMKNMAGIYGILAILAILLRPFIRIGAQYLLIKLTAAICSAFGSKTLCSLVDDFAAVMGLVLAMIAAVSIMGLISVVCFMRAVS